MNKKVVVLGGGADPSCGGGLRGGKRVYSCEIPGAAVHDYNAGHADRISRHRGNCPGERRFRLSDQHGRLPHDCGKNRAVSVYFLPGNYFRCYFCGGIG